MEDEFEPPQNLNGRSLEGLARYMKYTKAVTIATPFDTNLLPRCEHHFVGQDHNAGDTIDFDELKDTETPRDDLAKYMLDIFHHLPNNSLRSFR